jgi:hypothetical protein
MALISSFVMPGISRYEAKGNDIPACDAAVRLLMAGRVQPENKVNAKKAANMAKAGIIDFLSIVFFSIIFIMFLRSSLA